MRLYTLLYRPPSFATLPRITWELVERPHEKHGFTKRTDLPVSKHEFGVINFTERSPTPQEILGFELVEINPAP